jgi:hypothetical protein
MSVTGKFSLLKAKGKPNPNQNYTVTMADMTYPALRAKNIRNWPGKPRTLFDLYLELGTSQKECPALQKVETREY